MDCPALQPGEHLLVTSREVYVKSVCFEAFLTSTRIILRSWDDPRMADKDLPRDIIEDIFFRDASEGDPVLTIIARTRAGETKRLNLAFYEGDGPSRIRERAEWIRHLTSKNPVNSAGVPKKPQPSTPTGEKRMPYSGEKLRFNDGLHTSKTSASPVVRGSHKTASSDGSIRSITDRIPRDMPEVRLQKAREVNIRILGETYNTQNAVPPIPPPETYPCFCNRCGNRVTTDSLFCNRCGAELIVPEEIAACDRQEPVHCDNDTRPGFAESMNAEAPVQKEPSLLQETLSDPVRRGPDGTRAMVHFQYSHDTSGVPDPEEAFPVLSQNHIPHRSKKRILILVTVFSIVTMILAGFFLFGMIAFDNSPHANGSGSTLPVTSSAAAATTGAAKGTAAVLTKPAASQNTGTAPVPSDGIYVRVAYSGGWQGKYGTLSSTEDVSGSGEKVFHVVDVQEPVIATFQKSDASSGGMVVEIYRDGQNVQSGSTSDPTGTVSISAEV